MKRFLFFTIIALFFTFCGTPQGNLTHLKNRKMNNISALHEANKEVSTKPVFKGKDATVTALQIVKNGQLKEHTTKVEAFLVCVSGEVVFENEKGYKQTLTTGDYIQIEPMIKHWVNGIQDSQLLLIK
jgi:quercetin dioxygenase-like cupin family protein